MAQSINITEIQLYKALAQKLGEKEAEALVTFVQSEVHAQIEQQGTIISKDIALLKEHIDTVFASKEDLAKIETKVAESKFQLILWAFVFWATQLGAVFTFIKFLK